MEGEDVPSRITIDLEEIPEGTRVLLVHDRFERRTETYRRFREECLDLPNRLPALEGCSCMSCPYGPWNLEFHQRLTGL